MAGLFKAWIGEELAEITLVIGLALTGVGLDAIDARRAVFAGVIDAVIDVYLAIVTIEPKGTITAVAVDSIRADTIVETGAIGAVVDVPIAVLPLPARFTRARVICQFVGACAVHAGFVEAFVDFFIAQIARPTCFAIAVELNRLPHRDFNPRKSRPWLKGIFYYSMDNERVLLAFDIENRLAKGHGALTRWSKKPSQPQTKWRL